MNIKTLVDLYGLLKNQRLSAKQLRQIQNQKLRRMVKHAYENVVYYRRLFKAAGILPGDIQGVDDLHKIPITYKSNLQDQDGLEFLSKNNSHKIISMTTSGSTGFPLAAKLTQGEYAYWKLLLLRFYLGAGAGLMDNFVILAHPWRFPKQKKWFQYFGILRHKYVSALKSPAVFTAEIAKAKPDIILGYGGALKLFLLELEKTPRLKKFPRLIFSSAERLDQETRKLAKQLLGTDIIDLYSTVETGPLAWQCQSKRGYHINIDSVVVECIDKDAKTQVAKPGRIVCTNLFNFTMPFIRYCLDDIGTLTDRRCDCGSGFPLLESLEGKASDFLVLSDKVVSPVAVETILKKYVNKARYRIIQHAVDVLDLELLPGLGFDPETIPLIRKGIKVDLGHDDLNINIKIANSELFNQEKFRTVISYVSKSFS
jgi:phenylacetate-CoA ligase